MGQCVEGLCEACDPVGHAGCGAESPFCLGNAGTRQCAVCRDDNDCGDADLSQCVIGDCLECDPADNAGCERAEACAAGQCEAIGTCSDGQLNHTETDVDCGGDCLACANAKFCLDDNDCESGDCSGARCADPVDFCRLDGPFIREVVEGSVNTVSGAFFEAGLTDLTTGNDLDELVFVQVGYGQGGSVPTDGSLWSWTDATPTANWDGANAGPGDEVRDQYTGQFVIAQAGVYAFAVRVSVDGRTSWSYCDGGPEGSDDGYSAQTAGRLTVVEPEPTCDDGMTNGNETDIDCGGDTCDGCQSGRVCVGAGDCLSSVCGIDRRCQVPTCDDNVANGQETDVDCGGADCAVCEVGERCLVDADCDGTRCVNRLCALANCNDGLQNGQETGVDCGGNCGGCQNGEACTYSSDCVSEFCDWTVNRCTDSWLTQVCLDDNDRSQALAMTVAANRDIHLSRIETATGDLYYTVRTATGLVTNQVVAAAISQAGVVDVIDTDIILVGGEPAMCFKTRTGQLNVALRNADIWEISTVVNNASAGTECELAYLNDQLVIAYQQGNQLRYGVQQGDGSWLTQVADSPGHRCGSRHRHDDL